jgi:hypothetical protein
MPTKKAFNIGHPNVSNIKKYLGNSMAKAKSGSADKRIKEKRA